MDVGGGISLWYRTWGNRESGIPVLFVHGGPGNSAADYRNMNARFFDANQYFVIEPDQRGTGRSQPSVWDDISNVRHYDDLTIGTMSRDFELLRLDLGIDRWLVFGGSWGSTLGLDYTLRYPQRCLGAILRGIFLDARSEFDAIYRRSSFNGNDRLLSEFDAFLEPARREARTSGEDDVDPDDSERIVRLYERLVRKGDRDAIWRWYIFEMNIMEEDPAERRKYDVIEEEDFMEAGSVAFFESRLFLHGLFEEPMNLLGRVGTSSHRIKTAFADSGAEIGSAGGGDVTPDSSASLHYWICQGKRDEICPMRYAEELVGALEEASIPIEAHFVDGGHKASSPAVAKCLEERVKDFAKYFDRRIESS
uniref:prolyl aminopeptidase n=1 Tax=Odontella aurita TaxID=265563 RepID=A0A7S4HSU4_9STRA